MREGIPTLKDVPFYQAMPEFSIFIQNLLIFLNADFVFHLSRLSQTITCLWVVTGKHQFEPTDNS